MVSVLHTIRNNIQHTLEQSPASTWNSRPCATSMTSSPHDKPHGVDSPRFVVCRFPNLAFHLTHVEYDILGLRAMSTLHLPVVFRSAYLIDHRLYVIHGDLRERIAKRLETIHGERRAGSWWTTWMATARSSARTGIGLQRRDPAMPTVVTACDRLRRRARDIRAAPRRQPQRGNGGSPFFRLSPSNHHHWLSHTWIYAVLRPSISLSKNLPWTSGGSVMKS